ncbi:hypothetical protein EI969_23520 [Pseudomonas sp. PB101]|nr:hypothetical protein [Pseudomonas sp. PB101]
MFGALQPVNDAVCLRQPSRASPLPQGSPVDTNSVNARDPVGAGLPAMRPEQSPKKLNPEPNNEPPKSPALPPDSYTPATAR